MATLKLLVPEDENHDAAAPTGATAFFFMALAGLVALLVFAWLTLGGPNGLGLVSAAGALGWLMAVSGGRA